MGMILPRHHPWPAPSWRFSGASLTDVAQGLLMFAALVTVPIVTIMSMGGFGDAFSSVDVLTRRTMCSILMPNYTAPRWLIGGSPWLSFRRGLGARLLRAAPHSFDSWHCDLPPT